MSKPVFNFIASSKNNLLQVWQSWLYFSTKKGNSPHKYSQAPDCGKGTLRAHCEEDGQAHFRPEDTAQIFSYGNGH